MAGVPSVQGCYLPSPGAAVQGGDAIFLPVSERGQVEPQALVLRDPVAHVTPGSRNFADTPASGAFHDECKRANCIRKPFEEHENPLVVPFASSRSRVAGMQHATVRIARSEERRVG